MTEKLKESVELLEVHLEEQIQDLFGLIDDQDISPFYSGMFMGKILALTQIVNTLKVIRKE